MPKVTAITMMTPNHTGSKPSWTIGDRVGHALVERQVAAQGQLTGQCRPLRRRGIDGAHARAYGYSSGTRVARLYAAQAGLRALPLPLDIPPFEVRVHWHPRQESLAAHRWMREELVRTLSVL